MHCPGSSTRRSKVLWRTWYLFRGLYQLLGERESNWMGEQFGDFGGNAFRDGLLKSINSEKMNYARDMLLRRKAERSDLPCTTCSIYLGMKAEGKWLQRPTRLTRVREVISDLRQRLGSKL